MAFFARRPFQSWLMAVGGNRGGAFQSGLGLERIRVSAFLLSAIFAGIAALCLTGETATGDPLMGQSLSMGSISAVALSAARCCRAASAAPSVRCSAPCCSA